MADLRSIEGRTQPALDRENVIGILRDALAAAEQGKIVSVAIAMCHSDGDVETVASRSGHYYKLLGAVAQLQFNMSIAKQEG
jgi:hypothetical protein